MRVAPSEGFSGYLAADTRPVSFQVFVGGTDVTAYVKSMEIKRDAGDSKVATFTAASASEADITLAPASALMNHGNFSVEAVTISVGFDSENIALFSGSVRRCSRNLNDDTVELTCLDTALSLKRTFVNTPSMFRVNSAIYMREILEQAGFTSRAAAPNEMLFALDFDSNEYCAVTSSRKMVADTRDNGINQVLIYPHRLYRFNGKPYHYENAGRSQRLVVGQVPITHYGVTARYNNSEMVDYKRIIRAENAGGKQYMSVPVGYGGGACKNPSIIDYGSSHDGYRYWMVMQPSPASVMSDRLKRLWKYNGYSAALSIALREGLKGDPVVCTSDDGISWYALGTQPIATRPTYTTHVHVKDRDTDTGKEVSVTLDAGDEKLGVLLLESSICKTDGANGPVVVWRRVTGSTEAIWYSHYLPATDTWSTPAKWRTGAINTLCAPYVVQESDTKYTLYWINRAKNPNLMYRATSTTVGGTLTTAEACSISGLNGDYDIWRVAAIKDPSGTGYNACATLAHRHIYDPHRVAFMSSIDGSHWKINMNSLVNRGRLSWDNGGIHSGCFVPNVDTGTGQVHEFWYCACNANNVWGMGRTNLMQTLAPWEGDIPTRTPNGPVMWGGMTVTKCIDGVTPATGSDIFSQTKSDIITKDLYFGGWFTEDIDWSTTTNKFLMMEVNFGNALKAILSKEGTDIYARLYSYYSNTWNLVSDSSIDMSAKADWDADDDGHYVRAKITTSYPSANTYPQAQIRVYVDTYTGDNPTAVEVARIKTSAGLTSVGIISPMSAQLHTALSYTSTFPGLKFDNLFVSTVAASSPAHQYQLDKGLNRIEAAAYQGTDAWSELRSVAESELGCITFDYDNKFRFYNRHHYTSASKMGESAFDVSDDDYLISAAMLSDISSIKNVLNVKVKDQDLGVARDIWKADSAILVDPGEVLTFDVNVAGCLESLDTELSSNPTAKYGCSRFRARQVKGYDENGEPLFTENGVNHSAGGREGWIEINLTPFGRNITVEITNSGSRRVGLVDGNGNPYLYLWGRVYNEARFRSGESPVITRSDQSSIALYGANEYEIDLDFISTVSAAEALADYMLYRYSLPQAQLDNVKILGNPLLELGDRVTVSCDRLGLTDAEAWIEKITEALSPETGYTQSLTLAVADGGEWFTLDTTTLGTARLTY